MDTMDELYNVMNSWSFWDGEIPASIPRKVELPKELRDKICLVIQGVRRCGKSTLLQQLIGRYTIDPKNCTFVNFEDPRLIQHLTYQTLDSIVEKFRSIRPGVSRLFFFLDEIQVVKGWRQWLRTRLERPSGDIFVVTGSNSELLSGELSSSLTGRHLTVELFPFDFEELRSFRPGTGILEYLESGGFPEPLMTGDSEWLLRQYFSDIVEKDIRERLHARSSLPIRQVVQMVFESAGAEMSIRRVAAACGIAVDTASTYLNAGEQSYFLQSCPFFAFSKRRRSGRNRKYYPADTGLRRVVVSRSGADRGKSLECAVYLALRRRFGRVFYWRGKGEVDFVVHDRENGKIIPFQVTWNEPSERHYQAMDDFYENFPHAEETVWVNADSFERDMGNIL